MNYLVLLVILPLLAAFTQPIVSRLSASIGKLWGPLVLVIMAAMGFHAWGQLGDTAVALQIGGFKPPFGIVFYIDRLAVLFSLVVSLGTLLLWTYGPKDGGTRQSVLTLILAGSSTGLAFSGDLFNIYVFYELLSVASYGLVAAQGTAAGFAAAMRYIIISAFGSVLTLIGIALIYMLTGTLNLANLAQVAPEQLNNVLGLSAFFCILIGVGVKAELFPVNTWVPEVYATASKRVSGLLAGVVSKLALLIILRLLVLVFHQEQALQVMLVLGILGVLTGELAAWRATDLSRILAYSSIAQRSAKRNNAGLTTA